MNLTAEKVVEIFQDCLIRLAPPDEAVTVESLTRQHFDRSRLETHKAEIASLLGELPEGFRQGWTFLNACVDKHGTQWGEQTHVEQLFLLGLAVGLVKATFPRKMWESLPGGMPYYTVKV